MLFQRRFGPFFSTQFLGAFNDNLFKNVLVLLVTFNTARFGNVDPGLLANLAAGLFILPFVLFSAPAGQLADQRDKARLMQTIKLAEIGIMLLAGFGLALANLHMLLGALFLMGTHSAFFGPLKYSILPQVFDDKELIAGNAWVEMGTFVAILLGTLAAGYLVNITHDWMSISMAWVGVAIIGFATSLAIPAAPPVEGIAPTRLRFGWAANRELIAIAKQDASVWLCVLAISWFWLVGSVVLAQLPALAQTILKADASSVTALLAVFSVSVGAGSMLCEKFSGRKVEIGLVPLGAVGISVFTIDLWWTCEQAATQTHLFEWMAIDLGLMGVFSGFFIVPLYSYVQLKTPLDSTSRVIAANNILNAVFMVGGAGGAAAALAAGIQAHQLMLLAGALNAVVCLYFFRREPEFLLRCLKWASRTA